MIEFKNVDKSFKAKKTVVKALDQCSFKVNKGEIFGLLGPNGAGKTTSLRILSTLIKPSGGEVSVGNLNPVKDARAIRKKLGFLSSDMNLSGNLSARDLLTFFGRLNHIPETTLEKRIEGLSTYLEIKKFMDRNVSTYSTGMKQKTLIAIALIHEPEILIFDEPTNGLDIITSRLVLEYLKDLQNQGKTIILSTHIMTVAQKMCEHIVIIDRGRIKADGTLNEILEETGKDDLEDAFFDYLEVEDK